MSTESATTFIERVEADEAFASELEAVKTDPEAVLARVRAAGFDVTADEMREAFLARYSDELSPEQLDAIAAGHDVDPAAAVVVGAATAAIGAAAAAAVS